MKFVSQNSGRHIEAVDSYGLTLTQHNEFQAIAAEAKAKLDPNGALTFEEIQEHFEKLAEARAAKGAISVESGRTIVQ